MLKSILDLKETKILDRNEKQMINAGSPPSCWVVCPEYAMRVCFDPGFYTGECDCNC